MVGITRGRVGAMVIAVVAVSVAAAQADVLFVDGNNCPGPGEGSELDPYCSIQTAIDNAVDTDEIVVAPGTYFETINLLGKAIWLHSSNGADVTIIDAQQMGSVVTCDSGEGTDTVLEGFTITGGTSSSDLPDPNSNCFIPHATPGCDDPACEAAVCAIFPICCGLVWLGSCAEVAISACCLYCVPIDGGGGMLNVNSSPTVTNCAFVGNTVEGDGGGMRNVFGSPMVTDCTFTDNTAGNGGGMSNLDSSPTVTNCAFVGNTVEGDGGGMRNVCGNPMVTDCTFTANTAGNGGGMSNLDSSPTVTNCTFDGNIGQGFVSEGGGMFNSDSLPSDITSSPTVTGCTFSGNTAIKGGGMGNRLSSPTVSDCTFIDNTAGSGGGMHNVRSRPTVTDSTFGGNTAINNGGGMRNYLGNAMVTDCTFTDNTAGSGGGMYNESGSGVTNCTFIGNVAVFGGGTTNYGPGAITNCVLWGNDPDQIASSGSVSYCNVQGGYLGTGNIDADPLFVDPLTGNLRLQAGSPCIDAGDNTAVPQDITTDFDGEPRFVDDPNTIDSGNGDPPVVDMGAYEFQGSCPWDCAPIGGQPDSVDITDFLELLAQWGGPGNCDFDGGGVGINDFLELLANWGPCP